MFHLEVLAERLPLTSILQNITFIAYVQRLANVTKIAKFNLPSILFPQFYIVIGVGIIFFLSQLSVLKTSFPNIILNF